MVGIADAIIDFFDKHLNRENVRRFLVSEYQAILQEELLAENGDANLDRIGALLVNLGWIDTGKNQSMGEMESISDVNDAELWMGRLFDGHAISRNVVMVGAGENLDTLDSHRSQEDFIRSEAERLLRHVENRRKKSLSQFSENLDKQQIFNEKAELAIFFSRYAKRHSDLRFLNAAFKLNEWLMGSYRKFHDKRSHAMFLLALAEQENSAGELLR
jgi:hypothetical protein